MIGHREDSPPEGFKHVYGPEWRFGSLQLFTHDTPPVFWVTARGAIVPRLMRVDLEYAAAFARGHPDGWDYVVDARRVRFVHPYNLLLLRRVRELPNLRNWIVIATSGLNAGLLRAAPLAIRPDHIVSTSEEARTLVGLADSASTKAPATSTEDSV